MTMGKTDIYNYRDCNRDSYGHSFCDSETDGSGCIYRDSNRDSYSNRDRSILNDN